MITPEKIAHVKQLRQNAKEWGLLAPDSFWNATDEQLAEAYNGAGPDDWSDRIRKVCTFFLRKFREAVAIHDWEFQNSDGTKRGWNDANYRFEENMYRICDVKYTKWYMFLIKDFWYHRAYIAAKAVKADRGYHAWLQAARKEFPLLEKDKI